MPLIAIGGEIRPYRNGDGMGFTLPDLSGKMHTLPDYRGRVVLLNFWASWCPPCIQEMPELTRLQQRLSDKPFDIVAINVGEKKYKVWKFTQLINFELPVLLDTRNEAFRIWDVATLPTSFLVDSSGKVRYRIRGNPGWEHERTLAAIEQLIAEATTTANLNSPTQEANP